METVKTLEKQLLMEDFSDMESMLETVPEAVPESFLVMDELSQCTPSVESCMADNGDKDDQSGMVHSLNEQLSTIQLQRHADFLTAKSDLTEGGNTETTATANDQGATQIHRNVTFSDVTFSNVSQTSSDSKETHPWPENTVLFAGDSLLGGVDERKMSAKRWIKVRDFSGATVDDMMHYLKPLLPKKTIKNHSANWNKRLPLQICR